MKKITVKIASGASVEKPLVTAFKGTNGEYIVLDNEANGSMGLPIILVSKLANGRLTLIDDVEWNAVKESLRMIIAGNQIDYINVTDFLDADDMFYKQLTLPQQSFEALKNAYKPVEDGNAGVLDAAPVMDVATPTPVEVPEQVVAPEMNVMDANMAVPNVDAIENVTPTMPEQVIPDVAMPTNEPIAPIMPATPVQESEVVAPVEPVVPNVEPIPEVTADENVPVDFTADKEAFLKACENMFDALVAKFKN